MAAVDDPPHGDTANGSGGSGSDPLTPPPPPNHPAPLYLPPPPSSPTVTPAAAPKPQDTATAHPSTCRLSLRLACPLVADKLHLALSFMLHGSREQWRVHLGLVLRLTQHGNDVELPYSAKVHATVWRVVGGDTSDAGRWRRWAKVDIETQPRPP